MMTVFRLHVVVGLLLLGTVGVSGWLPGAVTLGVFNGRRALASAAAALPLLCGALAPAHAAATTPQFYWGVGCFWHVQHEFVAAEKAILGRTDEAVTSRAGYAGGSRVGKIDGQPGSARVCYHNLQGVADYGSLGHGEVVAVDVPDNKVKDFAKEYFSLFRNGDRPDRNDRGPEYRSLIGLPGGVTGPAFAAVEAVAKEQGVPLKLVEGRGDDADTLDKKVVWVMDSAKFPFYQGEIYHQFHDGFMPGEQYPETYNQLMKQAFKDGRITTTGCPDVRL